ncbi:protein STICHEL-like isoform X1 [Salvia miltiorrhiza]|uniref:protein STICHEL-like isoform X1 n=2 Tax=Salvia miltiorrhiza TaxID=226208 RepID=UPI0025AC6211|nr:protein STICHEL-like isoform X1 [Salvia miltiorrhiza]
MAGGGRSPNNLHWKKELTQIRKAATARVLRDPGTSSSTKNGRAQGNVSGSSSHHILQIGTNNTSKNASEREKGRVYLCNWKNQKSESERSKQIGDDDVEGSSSTQEGSFQVGSFNTVRNEGGHDSKSDGYQSDRFTASFFRCIESSFTPSIRRIRKKKSKRSNYSSPSSGQRLQMRMLLSRYTKNAMDDSPSVGLGREDLLSLIDQSYENGDYCNSEDLGRDSAVSHLLARLKNSKGWSCPPVKMVRGRRKEDDSVSFSTQALSTRSYNRYAIRNASTVESWDATTGSLNDGDDEVDDQLDFPGQQGCGIPCYWSRRSTPRSRNGSSCSPSLSDSLRRRGSSLFCGSQTMSQRRHHRVSLGSNKKRLGSKIAAAQGLVPLLGNSADGLSGSSVRSRDSDDELSAKLVELDLEGLSRLVRRRQSSSCTSLEGLELVALNGEVHKEGSENIKSLSHKYRPICFTDLIGQSIAVQSLMNAVLRGRIASVYLFQGPRGVGKTSMARIFAAALNCLATEERKPCGVCRECADFSSGKSRFIEEVDGSKKKGIDGLKNVLRNISVVHPLGLPHYKVIVIDHCHLLPSKAWLLFLRVLEKPLPFTVFILVTTDIDNVPRAILTRCQKHILNKIGNGDIVTRLRKISIDENLDVESNALELIASNADGSLRDAEIMLDQLSLFGKQITKSLVNELMGVVSEDKLLELLELAMSSNATETVRKSREMMDSGVDPLVLISQLVTLIVDIIAGTHLSVDAKHVDSFFGGKTLTERELHRLKHALTLLSEAEKHLRVSSERSTWFTATLLQLGSMSSPNQTQSTSSRGQKSKATEEDCVSMPGEATAEQFAPEKSASPISFIFADHCNSTSKLGPTQHTNQSQFNDGKSWTASHDDCPSRRTTLTCVDSEMLTSIWLLCIEKCHSKTLRLLLHSYGKLVSISETKGGFIAHIAFEDSDIKTRAQGFLSSITNSFEVVLRCNVEVKISLLRDSLDHKLTNEILINRENKSTRSNATGDNSDLDLRLDLLKVSRESFESMEDSKSDIPLQRTESIIHEQISKTASLQASDKGTPQSTSNMRPERNQVLPQDGMDVPLQHWGDKLNHEMKTLKMNNEVAPQKEQVVKNMDHCPISPSLLHDSTFASSSSKDNKGYESGSGGGGCSGMFCWNNRRPHTRGKAKKGTSAQRGRFSLLGECAKSRTGNRNSR